MQGEIVDLKQNMKVVQTDVAGLKQNMETVQGEIGGLKQNMSEMQEKMTVMQEDISGMKGDISDLKKHVARLDAGYENLSREMHHVSTVVDSMDEAIVGQFQLEIRRLRKDLRGTLIDWADMSTHVMEYALRLMGDYRDKHDLYHRPIPCI